MLLCTVSVRHSLTVLGHFIASFGLHSCKSEVAHLAITLISIVARQKNDYKAKRAQVQAATLYICSVILLATERRID